MPCSPAPPGLGALTDPSGVRFSCSRGSLAGIALGYIARGRIPQTGERGRGLAAAGIIVGAVTLVFAVAYWAFIAMHTGGGTGGGGGGY